MGRLMLICRCLYLTRAINRHILYHDAFWIQLEWVGESDVACLRLFAATKHLRFGSKYQLLNPP